MKKTVILGVALASSIVFAFEFEPRAVVIPEGEASASKLVWAGDGVATNGIVSYYRQAFRLPEVPTKAFLDAYLDDAGTVFVNGRKVPQTGDIAPFFVAGGNVIAIRLTNGHGSSAALYLVSCEGPKGDRFYLHSDGTVKGTVRPQPQGWEKPDFDDSAWPCVEAIGDVLKNPWARYHDLKHRFTTPEEDTRLRKAEADARTLPAGIEDEPDPVAKVVYQGPKPMVEINGKLHEPAFNLSGGGNSWCDSAVIRCARAGFEIVQVGTDSQQYDKGEGKPCDFTRVDEAARRILHVEPNAYLMTSIRLDLREWAAKHPDEQIGYGTGPADPKCRDDYKGRPIRASAASDVYRARAITVLREFAAFVRSKPWAKRVVAIRVCYGIYAEWHTYGMFEAPDTGKRMQEKFRAHMLAKRGLVDAVIPSPELRRRGGDLLDPKKDQLVLDYYDFHANTVADLLTTFAGEAKRLFPGRLVGAYYGYLFAMHPPEGANVLLHKVLASPDVDFLSNPPMYSAVSRLAGGSYAPRTIPSAFRRYGKLSILEDDSRFHHVYDWCDEGKVYATKTPRETRMNMRRNWLNMFFDGDGIQLCDPMRGVGARPNAFDDPAVFEAIAESKAALVKAGAPKAESGNAVAVVMSPRERLRRDGGRCTRFTTDLYQSSFLELNRSGTAYDLLTLEDYLADPRQYSTVVFLNAFYLTDGERQTLSARMRRPGMTAVWIGPAGGVTDAGFDDAAMSALTGVAATGTARTPKIVCGDQAAKPVCGGKAFAKDLPDGARTIIVPEPPRTGADYAALLKEAGAWAYVAPGSYFRRHGDVFMFHTGTPGKHVIRLPEGDVRVRELFSGVECRAPEFTVETDGPNTWLFKVER